MLTQQPVLDGHHLCRAIDNKLNEYSLNQSPMYGLFYKGKLLSISTKRIYYQKGRAKTELFRGFKHSIYYNNNYFRVNQIESKEYIEKLFNDGILEIKAI